MIFFFISLLTYFCYQTLKTRNALLVISKNKYNLSKYKKWIFQRKNFLTLELLGIILIVIAFMCDAKITGICALILYMFLSLVEIKKLTDNFKINKGNIGIIIITIIIYLIVFSLLTFDYINSLDDFLIFDHTNIYYLVVVILGYLNYLIMYLALIITNLFKRNKKSKKTKQNHKLK